MFAAPPRQSTDWAKAPAPTDSGGARRTRSGRCRCARPARSRRAGAGTTPDASNSGAASWSTRWRAACPTSPAARGGPPRVWARLLASGHAVNPRRRHPSSARAKEAGAVEALPLKAAAVFHRSKPQNPLNLSHRGVLVAFAEIVEAGLFDDVGDVNQAADHSERKPTRDREGDPVLQRPPGSFRSATTAHGEKLCW